MPVLDDIAKLVLRLTVAGLMLPHGISKLTGGIGMIEKTLTDVGLPAALAYGVFVGEVVAPVLILIGLFTRPAAVVLAINMLFAVGLAHRGDLFKLTEHGAYALELQTFYFCVAVAIALLGAGKFSARGGKNRWD